MEHRQVAVLVLEGNVFELDFSVEAVRMFFGILMILDFRLGIVKLHNLSGCGGEKTEDAEEAAAVEEGQYKIEIFTAESTAVPVNTTEDPTVIQKLLESPEWERITEVPGDLVPEFGLRIWKKVEVNYNKTEESEEPEYEVIETITIFKDTDCIERVYSSNAVKGANIPVSVAAFYYKVPQEFLDTVKELAK